MTLMYDQIQVHHWMAPIRNDYHQPLFNNKNKVQTIQFIVLKRRIVNNFATISSGRISRSCFHNDFYFCYARYKRKPPTYSIFNFTDQYVPTRNAINFKPMLQNVIVFLELRKFNLIQPRT